MLAEDFFVMEEEYKLFDLKTEDDTPIWDVVRMYIYLKYYFPDNKQQAEVKNDNFSSYINFIYGFFQTLCYFFFRKADYLFLPVSRNIDENGRYFDKASLSSIEEIGNKAFIFELQSVSRKYKYAAAYNYFEYYKKISKTKYEVSNLIFCDIKKALESSFGECRVTHQQLNEIFKIFKLEYIYYTKILKFKKVKKIFITNNGFRKGLFKAAKELIIPIYELQHGSFEKDHLAYSYPGFIKPNDKILLPDYLLTFGDYWGSYFNVPIKNKLPIGNNSFFIDKQDCLSDGSILIVSSKIHGKELYKVAKLLAVHFPERLIKFKLHSNEYSDAPFYIDEFKEFKSIQVYKSEMDIVELICRATLVILINSTVLYEALNQNKKVAIYKKVNFSGLANTFNLPNVYLFDEPGEIKAIIEKQPIVCNGKFFKAFDKQLFHTLQNDN